MLLGRRVGCRGIVLRVWEIGRLRDSESRGDWGENLIELRVGENRGENQQRNEGKGFHRFISLIF
jgi:hypothetical protein